MGKAELECPNCHGKVTLGEVTCPHCGLNLKSGESYEAQVKRAKGKIKHQGVYTGGLYAGIVFALSLCTFAGYMYQRKMENVLTERAAVFAPLVQKLQKVRDLADAGKVSDARTMGQDLLKEIQSADDQIKPGVAFDVSQVTDDRGYQGKKSNMDDRGAKRLLANLMAKTQYILDRLPAS